MGFFSKKRRASEEPPKAANDQFGNHVGVNYGSVTQGSFVQSGSGNKMDVRVNKASYSHSQVIGSVGGAAVMQFDQPQAISLNGRTFSGQRLEQRNGRILLDGKDITEEVAVPSYQLEIHITGNVGRLETTGVERVSITGAVGQVRSVSGAISVQGDVSGAVESVSGDITCGKVGGKVKTTSGDITIA